MSEYVVTLKKSAEKSAKKMPLPEQMKLAQLMVALKKSGPVQPSFMNYSKLGEGKYHCHLSLHWVACWKNEKGTLTIEVYYAGSRESAPYAKH
jgi:hypothetical protein